SVGQSDRGAGSAPAARALADVSPARWAAPPRDALVYRDRPARMDVRDQELPVPRSAGRGRAYGRGGFGGAGRSRRALDGDRAPPASWDSIREAQRHQREDQLMNASGIKGSCLIAW